MSFNDLPPQPPLNPQADLYGERCLALSRAALASTRSVLDVPYGSDYWQKVDIHLPQDASLKDLPVLLFFHGGGWTHGYKEWCGFMAPALVDAPAIVVSASYRLLPQVDFPLPLEDGLAALKWVFDHIGEYGGARDRIYVGGHSAGGQVASLLATHKAWRAGAGLPGDCIKACFCISTTFNRRVVNPDIAPDHVTGEDPDGVSPASSLYHASSADVPFFITWGGRELERYERFSRLMVDTLRAAGCPVVSHRFPECGHFDIHLNTANPDDLWTRTVRDWMRDGRFPAELGNRDVP
ncbi:alpha/beta hydrolase [Telluria beijingensis]|uniref:alpha/beta hydrolase n=1 Tax=Telluria beijingensis TaxID=3068633 RepID=UPI00279599AE|nr:alpha/beta hydrolase [Massilia sp. REN29]